MTSQSLTEQTSGPGPQRVTRRGNQEPHKDPPAAQPHCGVGRATENPRASSPLTVYSSLLWVQHILSPLPFRRATPTGLRWRSPNTHRDLGTLSVLNPSPHMPLKPGFPDQIVLQVSAHPSPGAPQAGSEAAALGSNHQSPDHTSHPPPCWGPHQGRPQASTGSQGGLDE